MLKVIWIARFRPDISKESGRAHWRDTHGVLGADVPELDRYLQNHTIAAVPPATEWPPFDGFSAGWYADDAAYVRSMASPEWAAIGADSDNLFDTPFFWGMSAFVDEHVVAAPPVGGVKLVGVVRFAAGEGDRWVADAAPLLAAVPGVAGVVLDVAGDAIGVEGRTTELELGFAGVAELWFGDRTTLTRSLASPEWQAALEVASAGDASWAVMEERLVTDDTGPASARVAAGR